MARPNIPLKTPRISTSDAAEIGTMYLIELPRPPQTHTLQQYSTMTPKAKKPKPTLASVSPRTKESGDHSFSLSLFSSCSALLEKLMTHPHGWLFNAPVDVKKLRLKDYYSVIRHTMDLGTVKCRVDKGRYKSPLEFASDVRLIFRNAMTYNHKNDTAYAMAEELLGIFESDWPSIEAQCNGKIEKDIDLGIKRGFTCKAEDVEEEWETKPSKLARKEIEFQATSNGAK